MVQNRIYRYFDNYPNLHVLFIFDRMGIIENDLFDSTWKQGFRYEIFDGGWFGAKYNIEHTWKDDRIILLFREETFPHTEEQMLKFPLLDLLKANKEYKEDDYASFMQQYDLPEKFAAFVSRHISELMSSRINALLSDYYNPQSFSEDVVCRAFISDYLGSKKLFDWEHIIIRMLILGLESENKKKIDFYTRLQKNRDAEKSIEKKLNSIFGFSYNKNLYSMQEIAESMKYNSFTQLLDTVQSDNYKKYKISNALTLEQINKIFETARIDRALAPRFYEALDVLGSGIQESSIIDNYGIDANYFYVTEALCWPILKKILEDKMASDPEAVTQKMQEFSLKMPIGSDIQFVIDFINNLSLYYSKLSGIGILKLNTPDDYIQKYLNDFQYVDYFYRRVLEAYHVIIKKDIPIESAINNAKKQLDLEYAKITNVLNLEWLDCVKEKGSAFDSVSLPKQERFYETENDSSVKQVVIISDALRYEVAQELIQELSKEKHMAQLTPCLASLPTETKFCKPSLLAHTSLKLQGTDMAVDGQVLSSLDLRTTHASRYRENSLCVTYESIMDGDAHSKREIFKKPLVYIFHNTIDEACHSQSPFEVIAACRRAIEQLSVLVRRLHATWNVHNVIITSDHGFIYNDMKFEEKDKHSITEDCIEKKTRYYLTMSNAEVEGIVKFPLEKVSKIQSSVPTYVGVPKGTNRLAASGGYNFAHGGASLQEMIIPVIHSNLRRIDKTEKVGVTLLSRNLNMVSSRLRFQLIQSDPVNMTTIERKVVCAVYKEDQQVTEAKTITLNSTDATNVNNRLYDISLVLNTSVDASILQLRVYDEDDKLNPLIKETVKNNTLFEQDF